jgi:hypothetical protein
MKVGGVAVDPVAFRRNVAYVMQVVVSGQPFSISHSLFLSRSL